MGLSAACRSRQSIPVQPCIFRDVDTAVQNYPLKIYTSGRTRYPNTHLNSTQIPSELTSLSNNQPPPHHTHNPHNPSPPPCSPPSRAPSPTMRLPRLHNPNVPRQRPHAHTPHQRRRPLLRHRRKHLRINHQLPIQIHSRDRGNLIRRYGRRTRDTTA